MSLSGGPVAYFLMYTIWELLNCLGTGDLIDGHWYNNSTAIGHQIYPKGIHKYFDMHSWHGFMIFSIEWLFIWTWDFLLSYTGLIPLDLWWYMFTLKWDGMDRFFLYYVPWGLGLNTAFGILAEQPSEGQWGILWN